MSIFAETAKPEHKAAARSLGYALTLGDAAGWSAFTLRVYASLSRPERAGMAYAALMALDMDDAATVASRALGDRGAGQPIAPLLSHLDEAAFWADMAEITELEAYCFAAFTALPAHRRDAFLDFVQGRAVA